MLQRGPWRSENRHYKSNCDEPANETGGSFGRGNERLSARYRGCYVSLSTDFEFCVAILYHSTLSDARKHTSTCTPE
jgi:hypothetical protein